MKKLLLSLFMVGAMVNLFAQTDLFISEYVEGSGNNKAIELYNPTSETIDLSTYILVRFSNGENYPANGNPKTTSGGYLELKGTLAPGECHVIVNGQTEDTEYSPACSPELQALADQLDVDYPSPTYMNGNDAMAIMKTDADGNWLPVDIFGSFGLLSAMKNGYGWAPVKDSVVTYKNGDADVTATIKNFVVPSKADDGQTFGPFWMAWSKDHTLIRKPSVTKGLTSNPEAFDVSLEWDTLPAVNVGDTMWSQKDIWTNLGTHKFGVDVSDVVKEEVKVKIYPNPSEGGIVTLSANKNIVKTEMYNMIGKLVSSVAYNGESKVSLQTSSSNNGVYLIKVIFEDNSTAVQRLIIK